MENSNKLLTEKKEVIHEDDYLREAKETIDIVNNGVEKGSFSELNEKLGELPNMSSDREKYVFERNSSTMYILGLIVCSLFLVGYLMCIPIFIGTLIYSNAYNIVAIMEIIIIFIVFIFNSAVLVDMFSKIRFNRRYDVYIKDLRFKNIEIIDDLAVYSKINIEKVIKDLKRAVKLKLIPQGQFGCDNLIFISSNKVYNKYKDKQAIYDRYYRKLVEERLRMKERTKEMQKILDQGKQYVDKIHESKNIINDKDISQKLNRMENVVSMIFYEVDINPQHASKLGMFMSYYLPTTEKLLEAYIEINEKQVKGKTLQKTKKDIDEAIDKIIDSFEGLLDKFYQEKELDIATDISTMEILMKQDGLIE